MSQTAGIVAPVDAAATARLGGARLGLAAAAISLVPALALWTMGLLHPGSTPHHSLLAYSLLHGRVDVATSVYDSVPYHGKAYLPFGPLPAILMVLPVLLLGPLVPSALLALPLAIATIPALDALWRALDWQSAADRRWLTLLATAGTVWLSAFVVNSSYYVNHLAVVVLLTWALVLALRGKMPLGSGVLVAMATLTRSNAVLAALPLAAIFVDRVPKERRAAVLGMFGAGCAAGVVLTLGYNAARFGSLFDSGYGLQRLAFGPLRDLRAQGVFALVHVPRNLYYFLVAPPFPFFEAGVLTPGLPWLAPSLWGLGLVWCSPWVFAAVLARGRLALILGAGAALMLLPIVAYYGVGWIQFGYRYALDALPLLAALAALGLKRVRTTNLLPALGIYCVAVNIAGAWWLINQVGA